MGAKTNRGQLANLDQQNEVADMIAQLEGMGRAAVDPTEVEGRYVSAWGNEWGGTFHSHWSMCGGVYG